MCRKGIGQARQYQSSKKIFEGFQNTKQDPE